MLTVRRATAADDGTIRSLLAEAELPVDDFEPGDVAFLVAEDEGEIVGTIGLESYPPVGLLRSAAVSPGWRDAGIGAVLVRELMEEARGRSLTELVLLTTTAEAFFRKRGFERVARESLPPAVLASRQFTGTRCASAAVMRIALPGAGGRGEPA